MKALTLAAIIAAAPVAARSATPTLAAPFAGGTVHSETAEMSI